MPVAAEVKRRSTAPAGMLDDTLDHICNDPFQDHPQGGAGNENGLWGSGALVAASQQATHWPMGSNNSHQRQRGWAAQTSPSSFHIDLPGLPSLVFADSVDRPVQQHTWVLPQYDGAGDLSSEDISFLDKDDVMSLLAPGGLGDDDADSEQRAGGEDEVEEIQPQVPYVVFVFLAKMRALVVRRRRHQLGAVAESLALDSCRKRMLERAVIARFAKSKISPSPPPPGVPLSAYHLSKGAALTSHVITPVLLCLHALPRAMFLTKHAHAPTCTYMHCSIGRPTW